MRNRNVIRASALLLALVACLGFLAAREPVAVVVSLSGKVEVQKAGAARAAAATVGQALDAGDRVLVPGGGKAVLMYSTGKMETATAAVTVAAPERQDRGGLYARTVNTITQVATTDAKRQPNRQGMIRPVQGAAEPIAPRNNVRVLDVRPTFVWFSAPNSPEYMVQLRRIDVPGARPVRFSAGRDTVWTYPSNVPALVPGAQYEWTVGPSAGGRIGQPKQFRVVGATEFAQLSGVLDELSAAGVDPAGDGLFVLALAYRDAGLLYEAESALAQLAAAGNGNGRVFHLLRGEVLDGLGDLEGASREFVAADSEAQ